MRQVPAVTEELTFAVVIKFALLSFLQLENSVIKTKQIEVTMFFILWFLINKMFSLLFETVSLKGNGALGGHVTKFGYDGTKKFLDLDLVYKTSVIFVLASVKTREKLD